MKMTGTENIKSQRNKILAHACAAFLGYLSRGSL
jgi:hypothetical protein